MSIANEALLNEIERAKKRIESFILSDNYIHLFSESTPDTVIASLLLSAFLIKRNIPFAAHFVNPLFTEIELNKYVGQKVNFGCIPQNFLIESVFEISHNSSCNCIFSEKINPYKFGLNGALIGSTACLTYMIIKDEFEITQRLAPLLVAASITSQSVYDADVLVGLNKEMLDSFVSKGNLASINSPKIPLAEGVDLSTSLFLTLEPYIPGVTGDKRGAQKLVKKLSQGGLIKKTNGIFTGEEARAIRDEISRLRSESGFKELPEKFIGTNYISPALPLETPIRNLIGTTFCLEACVNKGEYSLIYKLALIDDKKIYSDVLDVLDSYVTQVANAVIQILQTQEYVRETQNALYVLSPKGVSKEIALRVAKTLAQHSSAREKPVLVVDHIGSKSYIAAASLFMDTQYDLGRIFYSLAKKYRGIGKGLPYLAEAVIPTQNVEEFFDEVDVQLGSPT
ncbi:hypothetical protein B9Q13_06340 [Candidatus Marsarchaeota G2 archaeon ECH_B_SAG-G16]|jgi:RecJ-like exonuclease|uniref:DHHA1 domain-containing protein n=5 Tax=Candidatus Marsarchaeota TaxID=1978152 RepID=A0A2R6AK53_9ARCH|nr:MAG: hypothetical protein B9Q02_00785 [Candidatus Marsarchaeota G1 archaeon BE_D]PSN89715.1 MAG: hypothetical protein B9Q00_00445 [Candidatus Marsarchaeota G1 archaeon OSP_C]PSO02931.1 MAG: hypothetical protein B9Q10_00835 [Candidatus Marsarchaeota G2 archaeon ECH_B_SAG-E12]PSO03820.1 MAG: hypothetical protein B9Q13_06340 [Candidatus Marsarchaeota G2 archaeon ECH_B_SAG-G16]